MIDADLKRVWVLNPVERTVNDMTIIVGGTEHYGDQPWRFRPVRQNGSRLHLRLLAPDGTDARYPDDVEYVGGQLIERRAYTSDVRRGVYWTPEEDA